MHGNREKKLLDTTNIFNVNLKILGQGVEWESGHVTKLTVLKEFLESSTKEYICLTDSRDVLYAANEETIYETFLDNFDSDSIIFNGETNCFPDPNFAELHPHQEKKYKYLNSGCVIGSQQVLKSVVNDALELLKTGSYIKDDQYLFQKIFLSKKYNISLDYDCKIFQCIWDEDWGRNNNFDLVYTKDYIYNRLTKTIPLIFHYPGPTCVGSQAYKVITKNYYSLIDTTFLEKKYERT
jgi:hypothetical protein